MSRRIGEARLPSRGEGIVMAWSWYSSVGGMHGVGTVRVKNRAGWSGSTESIVRISRRCLSKWCKSHPHGPKWSTPGFGDNKTMEASWRRDPLLLLLYHVPSETCLNTRLDWLCCSGCSVELIFFGSETKLQGRQGN